MAFSISHDHKEPKYHLQPLLVDANLPIIGEREPK